MAFTAQLQHWEQHKQMPAGQSYGPYGIHALIKGSHAHVSDYGRTLYTQIHEQLHILTKPYATPLSGQLDLSSAVRDTDVPWATNMTDRQTEGQTEGQRQTDRQWDRQTDRQTDRQRDRQTEGQTEGQTDSGTDRQWDRQTVGQTEVDRQTEGQTEGLESALENKAERRQ